MNNIAVFASGNGSNFQAIVQAIREGWLKTNLTCVISDQPDARVLKRAEVAKIPAYAKVPKTFPSKLEYEQSILEILKKQKVDYIVLAGYMRLVGSTLLDAYKGRIINIHPSLLPSFPGLHAIEKAYEARVKETGVTIHYVDEGMDTGPIIAQESLEIFEGETLESLEERIHLIEHQLYPKVLNQLLNQERRVTNE